MLKQPLSYCIEFDGKAVTLEEQREAFLSLVNCLLNLSAQSQAKSKKYASKKCQLEDKIFMSDYHQKFHKVLLQKISKNDQNAS